MIISTMMDGKEASMEMWIGLIGGIGAGVLSAVVTSLAARRKTRADATRALTDAAVALVEPLEKRLQSMEAELKNLRPLEAEVAALRAGVQRLIEQIRCLGHEPVWVPKE